MNRILKEICALPTSPYREHRVMEYIQRFALRNGLAFQQDRHGNCLVTVRPGKTRWVMVAHMDHPGLIAGEQLPRGLQKASFRGYVLANHMRQAPVVFFSGRKQIRGRIVRAIANERGAATEVHVRLDRPVAPGACGMFDLEVAKESRGVVHSRALDDLAGAAAALQALVNARKQTSGAPAAALFTRAEEDGFVGALAAAIDGKLISKSDRIISIECSAMQSYAPQGEGVVIRVGDRASIFDSEMTHQITETAQTLAKEDDDFLFQRALMPGGVCEATALLLHGYRSAAVCLPLGNYHNMVPGKKQLAAEYIHMGDWECLVKLLSALVAQKPQDQLKAMLKSRMRDFTAKRKLLLVAEDAAI